MLLCLQQEHLAVKYCPVNETCFANTLTVVTVASLLADIFAQEGTPRELFTETVCNSDQ